MLRWGSFREEDEKQHTKVYRCCNRQDIRRALTEQYGVARLTQRSVMFRALTIMMRLGRIARGISTSYGTLPERRETNDTTTNNP